MKLTAIALAVVATLGLGAAMTGGNDNNLKVSSVEFIGMPAPSTDAERTAAYTTARVRVTYSDGGTTEGVLSFNRLFYNTDKVGGSYAAGSEPSNVEVSSFSKSWPCLFPQHGPGTKHTRRIWLAGWQQELAERWPEALLRGMIQSDGCRFTNTRGRSDSWSAPRYGFSNMSTDVISIFCTACDKVGLRWTAAFPEDERRAVTIYVSRKRDVARMDDFIGPKA